MFGKENFQKNSAEWFGATLAMRGHPVLLQHITGFFVNFPSQIGDQLELWTTTQDIRRGNGLFAS